MQMYLLVSLLLSLLGVAYTQQLRYIETNLIRAPLDQTVSDRISSVASLDDDLSDSYRLFKKAYVRPCVYNMGNCLTTAQQRRIMDHLRHLVALKEK